MCQYVDMVCVHCGHNTRVVNTREQKRSNQVWRRRQCETCKAVFTTEEAVVYQGSWTVRSSACVVRPFSRDKLFISLYESCQHRSTALNDAAGLTDTVIKKTGGQIKDGVVSRRSLVQTAQVALNRFDEAASVHYQAFHHS
jgi:transcriptional regulator NrdR family protein